MSYNSTEDGPSAQVVSTSSINTKLYDSASKLQGDEQLDNKATGDPVQRPSVNDSTSSDELERQPLIRGQLLSPDDPIVSPMNLYSIKVIKLIIWVMWVINCICFFILILSDFISIPGMNNRGRSFLEVDLVVICAFSNLLTLWCFVYPAYYERILGYVSAALFAIDFIVIVSVTYLRHQFGWIGNLLVFWTIATLLLNCYADYNVEKGKRYQEIKYTGRPETRKTFVEAFVISVKIVIKFILLVAIWNISLTLWLMAFDTHLKPPGEMVPVNNDQFKIHLSCNGDMTNGTQPIVLVEGGQKVSSEEFETWIEELFHLNKIERYCIYDRPGYAFSDSAPSPISISIITDYLNEALLKKEIVGPFTLVGFDNGGLYSRVFASKNPSKIDSIMLVDSWHEDLLKLRPFPRPETYKFPEFDLMTTFVGFKLWFKGIISPLGLVTNIHWFLHPRYYSSKSRVYGQDMIYQSQYLRSRLQEQITSLVLSYNEVAGSDISEIPLYVISSDYLIKKSKNWGNWQRQLTKLSKFSQEWTIIEDSEHNIWESVKGKKSLQDALVRVLGSK